MFLLARDMLSSLRRQERNTAAVNWIKEQQPENLYLSAFTVGEVECSLARRQMTRRASAEDLTLWWDGVLAEFGSRILPVDTQTAHRWGQLASHHNSYTLDLLIVATALEHDLTVVTCDSSPFEGSGVPVLQLSQDDDPTPQHHCAH